MQNVALFVRLSSHRLALTCTGNLDQNTKKSRDKYIVILRVPPSGLPGGNPKPAASCSLGAHSRPSFPKFYFEGKIFRFQKVSCI
jgi:hypothetical protein